MTWQELKQHVNSLDEKQLSENVQLWRDNETILNIGIDTTNEDHYYVPEDQSTMTESEVKINYKAYPKDYETPINELKKVSEKGFPYLYED